MPSLQSSPVSLGVPASPGFHEGESADARSSADAGVGLGLLHNLREAVFNKGHKTLQLTRPKSKMPIYTDCNAVMESWVGSDRPDQKDKYADQLKSLHNKVTQVTGGLRPP